MKNVDDLRRRRTKKYLMNAFAQLLTEKSLAEITVREIVERAEVSRTTFYRNYMDKEDFIEQIKNELLEGLLAAVTDSGSRTLSTPAYYQEYFRYFYKNRILFKSFINGGKWPEFYNQFYTQGIRAYTLKMGKEDLTGKVSMDILIHYITSAHVGTVQNWLEKDCPCPPEQIAQQISYLTVEGILKSVGFHPMNLEIPR